MEVSSLLCDSFLCRLCAQENKNGANLFPNEENEQDLSELVNKYLPIKVERDGKLPSTICPGCNFQLEATKSFLDLIIEGQNKLRELFRNQQDTLRRQEKQRLQLEEALKNVNPSSSVETYTIQSDETGEKFLIQIFSEGPLFPPDHELSLRGEGLSRPRKKRGRPPKALQNEERKEIVQEEVDVKNEDNDDESELDTDGRRKRRIKVPSRFLEAVQGKELERILKEEGVTDDSSSDTEMTAEERKLSRKDDEIIGHLQSKDGENLGELVVINKNSNRMKIKSKSTVVPKKKKKYDCELCGREFLHYGRYEVHKTFHKNLKYKCNSGDCGLTSDTKLHVEEHQKETGHVGVTIIEGLDLDGQLELPQPVKQGEINIDFPSIFIPEKPAEEKQENKITCEVCGKTFSCKQNYEVHCKAVHEKQRPYQCEKCDKSFPYLNSLKCHMLQHNENGDKMYPCEICRKVFNHPSSLVYHREAEHNNGRRFVCNKCDKSFKHRQLLQRHQLVHSDERPYSCKMCGASFKTRANLLNHMLIHTGEKRYYCTQCPQTFAHKTSLTLHTRWHNGHRPYQCDVCMKSFSQKGNLAEHKRIHTGEKPYCCDHCGRKFTTSSQFKLHVKRHTGERPWKCEYCSKSFLHKDTWKCHTRRHRNERPYQCMQCFRGFTEHWALKKHERLHTGEKPYICEVCDRGFADCSNLAKHKKIHLDKTTDKMTVMKVNGQEDLKFKGFTEDNDPDNQVLFLTYENLNSDDGDGKAFVQIMDNLDQTMPSEDSQTGSLKESLLDSAECLKVGEDDLSLDPMMNIQQVIDQEGNPISLTTQDGQQMKVVTTLDIGQQCIQGLMPNGSLIPINLSMQEGKAVVEILAQPDEVQEKPKDDVITDEGIDSPLATSPGSELLDSNIQFLTKLDNNIQFLTEDGQNVCLVAAYNVEDSINQQYLTMA